MTFQVLQRIAVKDAPHILFELGHDDCNRQAKFRASCSRCGCAVTHEVPYELEDLNLAAGELQAGNSRACNKASMRTRLIPLKVAFETIHRDKCRFGLGKLQAWNWTKAEWDRMSDQAVKENELVVG